MNLNTIYRDMDFLTGDIKTGIKKKNLKKLPTVRGITKIQLLNKDTMEVERETVAENLIKDAYYQMYKQMMKTPFTNIGINPDSSGATSNYSSRMPQVSSVAAWIYLLNSELTPVETTAYRTDAETTIGYATTYSSYSSTSDQTRGSVVPNLCVSKPDIANKQNIYSMVFEFPQYCANGTFNKVQFKTHHTRSSEPCLLEFPDPSGSLCTYGERTNRFTGQYSVDGHATLRSNSTVHNGWMYWINLDELKSKSATTHIYRAELSELKGVVTGGGATSNNIELLCTVDLSGETFVTTSKSCAGIKLQDDGTMILSWFKNTLGYNEVYSDGAYNATILVKSIDLGTGVMSDVGGREYVARRCYYGSYDSVVKADISPDGTKLLLFSGSQGYYSQKGGLNTQIFDITTGTELFYRHSSDNYDTNNGSNYDAGWINDNDIYISGMYENYIYRVNSEYTGYDKSHNIDISGYHGWEQENGDLMYDKIIQRFYSFNKNTYTTINFNSESVLCENDIVTPITKTVDQIMRVQYDFIVPWDDEAIIYNSLDYDDVIPV